MKVFSSLRQYIRANEGLAAIEMAFVFPFMMLLYLGLLDLTGLITHSRKVTTIASAVADLVAQNRTAVLKTDLTDYFKIASMVMKPASDADVRIRVHVYRKVSNTPTLIWTVENGKGPNCTGTVDTSDMLPLMVASNDLIVTQTCATFEPYTGEFLGEKLIGTLTPQVEQTITIRPRASPMLTCYETVVDGSLC
jgi:Flp pilus assembly protein TadG